MAKKAATDVEKVLKAIKKRINMGYSYEDDLKVTLSSGKDLYTDIDDPDYSFSFYTKWYDEDRGRYLKGYVVISEDPWKEMDQEAVIKDAIDSINSENYIDVEGIKWAEEIDAENARESW